MTGRSVRQPAPVETPKAIDRVYCAWIEPGAMPSYHRHMQRELQAKWPMMYEALVALEDEMRGERG